MSEPRRNDHVRVRPRRLRRTSALRQLVTETRLHPSDLVLPLFYREGLVSPKAIPSMPGSCSTRKIHCAWPSTMPRPLGLAESCSSQFRRSVMSWVLERRTPTAR